ncbi:MAG: L-ribulokinase [Acidobacteria bacterium]|jgi:L-ribulokinase|nr:L-ribulokinase [Acidobacteriota bacterium]
MSIVAGVDFGTLTVRVSVMDSGKGRLGSATAEYPLFRKREDPDYATQRHADHMDALMRATRQALENANVRGEQVEALALDTTGSTIVPVGPGLEPLDDYYLWCDHRAKDEAALITDVARRERLAAIDWIGGVYSSEWGFAKLLHWLRHNPGKRGRMVSAVEHCDMVAAVLCGINDIGNMPRSVCAMGHKWMWNGALGGLPPEDFLVKVDPLLRGVRDKLKGRYLTSDKPAGRLVPEWASRLGLRAGIPIPIGAFDAHWDAIGAGVREGDVVNVVGTSTCIMAIARQSDLIPGVCGVVKGSIHPEYFGIEAGLSASGDIFEAISRRAGSDVATLSVGLERYRAGQTGLMRLTWDNGDRTVLVNPELGGATLGWNLTHTAQDELFAAIEGTAFHTRVVLERMAEHGVPIRRVINGGGIPQKNDDLNRVYANVLNKPVLVPESEVTSLGSAIFAFVAAGTFPSIEEAQQALCPAYRVVQPEAGQARVYEQLYPLFRKLYFALGSPAAGPIEAGDVLPVLRKVAAEARSADACA